MNNVDNRNKYSECSRICQLLGNSDFLSCDNLFNLFCVQSLVLNQGFGELRFCEWEVDHGGKAYSMEFRFLGLDKIHTSGAALFYQSFHF